MRSFSPDCLRDKAILITGGLGAIGKVIVTDLLEYSAQVMVNDLLLENEARARMQEAGWAP